MQRCRIGQGECRFRWSKRISIIVVMGRTNKRIRQRELGLGHAQHADMMWSTVVDRTIKDPLIAFILLCSSSYMLRSTGGSQIPGR